MAWDHLSIDRPHLVYIILGGFTSIFMLVSLFIKEKLYIGEATVATICGVIFGPHGANLINPLEWGERGAAYRGLGFEDWLFIGTVFKDLSGSRNITDKEVYGYFLGNPHDTID